MRLGNAIRTYCSEHSIAIVLKSLCEKVPEAVPDYNNWAVPNPVPAINRLIQTTGDDSYVEKMIPTLRIMLGNNISNWQWAARVLICLTIFKVVESFGEKNENHA
jgi:hypothetical protein